MIIVTSQEVDIIMNYKTKTYKIQKVILKTIMYIQLVGMFRMQEI